MQNIQLSKEDIQILKWEKEKRENDAKYSQLPNCEAREKMWKKSWDLMMKINYYIYDTTGSFRKDKRHLLTGGSLDIKMLDRLGA